MNLFKKRIIEAGQTLIGVVGVLLICGIASALLVGFDWLLNWIWEPLNEYFFGALLIGFFAIIVGKGLYWLFIEPFRKGKKNEEA
jgi:hypothetical protein